MEDKFFNNKYSPIGVIGELAHSSYKEYALADANTIGGIFRVEKESDIEKISEDILRNEGFRVYALNTKKTYRLVDFDKHNNLEEGWVWEVSIDIPPNPVEPVPDVNIFYFNTWQDVGESNVE